MKHEARSINHLQSKMALLALADPSNLVPPVGASATTLSDHATADLSNIDVQNPGLTRSELEDRRWKVSALVGPTGRFVRRITLRANNR